VKWCFFLIVFIRAVSAQPSHGVLELDTFVVEATRVGAHPWRYLSIPGYEILSQCDEGQTEAVAEHLANSLELERRLMPADSWGEVAVPLTFILFNSKHLNFVAPYVPKSMREVDRVGDFGRVLIPDPQTPNLVTIERFDQDAEKGGGTDSGDSDTHCVVQNRWNAPWNWAGGEEGRGPIPLGRLFRVNNAVPPMPTWFEYGLVGPCALFRMRHVRDPQSHKVRGVVVAAASWLTDETTTSLVDHYNKEKKIPVLPPISDLFRPDHTPQSSSLMDWPSPEYMAEAALFLRWGMTPVAAAPKNRASKLAHARSAGEAERMNEAHQKAFSRFLSRCRNEPATESVFRDCFGFGYAEMQSILSRFLVTTAQEPFLLNPLVLRAWSPNDPVPSTRAATAAEVGRIIGDWLRMQADSFPAAQASEREAYLETAGHVLEQAFREQNGLLKSVQVLPPKDAPHAPSDDSASDADLADGPVAVSPSAIHDPHFLAVYGLYYFDRGDAISARVLLEASVQAKAPRPAAYIALSRLNRAVALAKPAGYEGRWSATQVAAVLTPLFTVIKNWKLEVGGYLLIADAWAHSGAKPSLANLQVLLDGLHRYPLESSLRASTADVYAKWGYSEEADKIIRRQTF